MRQMSVNFIVILTAVGCAMPRGATDPLVAYDDTPAETKIPPKRPETPVADAAVVAATGHPVFYKAPPRETIDGQIIPVIYTEPPPPRTLKDRALDTGEKIVEGAVTTVVLVAGAALFLTGALFFWSLDSDDDED